MRGVLVNLNGNTHLTFSRSFQLTGNSHWSFDPREKGYTVSLLQSVKYAINHEVMNCACTQR